ncbi:NEQ221 [Nanoarchaeum equitans Kin4-M]|uniref:NEQ221 n=1 Tax=Nanoarchaeum equitans (strain Kin4-M) TaxID=228908 RepID=Q74MQ5_NANEQ|nr:NEQ221 [Nanoarchaeum equitans Kin4-M]
MVEVVFEVSCGKTVTDKIELPDNIQGREKFKYGGKMVKMLWDLYKKANCNGAKVKIIAKGKKKAEKTIEIESDLDHRKRIGYGGKVVRIVWELYDLVK